MGQTPQPTRPEPFHIQPTAIAGCLRIRLNRIEDARGALVKSYQASFNRANGLATDFTEEFHSISRRGVLRGMHVMLPPLAQTKTVCCALGSVLDAVLDLRVWSPTFGRHACFQLDAATPEILYVPPGVAHGFLAQSDLALMLYRVTTEHRLDADGGVRWDSCGIPWGIDAPIVSPRDQVLPPLVEFANPFVGPTGRSETP